MCSLEDNKQKPRFYLKKTFDKINKLGNKGSVHVHVHLKKDLTNVFVLHFLVEF